MYIVLGIIFSLFLLWISYGYFSLKGIEEPSYQVLEKVGKAEIREYDSMIIAKVIVEGNRREATNKGFSLLADYIFGNNVSEQDIKMTTPVKSEGSEIKMTTPVIAESVSQEIKMTTPVQSEKEEGKYVISFVMPAKYTLETLPKPVNSRVLIEEIPKKKYAALKFSGFVWDEKVAKKEAQLLEILREEGVEFEGKVSLSQYNPPLTPWFMRRNEIWVELSE